MLIAPSILNADNLNLENDVKDAIAAGISRFHIDIMDGHLCLIFLLDLNWFKISNVNFR